MSCLLQAPSEQCWVHGSWAYTAALALLLAAGLTWYYCSLYLSMRGSAVIPSRLSLTLQPPLHTAAHHRYPIHLYRLIQRVDRRDQAVVKHWGFLYLAYADFFWWWEPVVEIGKKWALVSVATFVSKQGRGDGDGDGDGDDGAGGDGAGGGDDDGGGYGDGGGELLRVCCLSAVLLLAWSMHARHRPYRHDWAIMTELENGLQHMLYAIEASTQFLSAYCATAAHWCMQDGACKIHTLTRPPSRPISPSPSTPLSAHQVCFLVALYVHSRYDEGHEWSVRLRVYVLLPLYGAGALAALVYAVLYRRRTALTVSMWDEEMSFREVI